MKSLSVKSLTLSLALVCGLIMLGLGWIAAFGWGEELVKLTSSFYIGYKPTFIGGIIGGIWGFVYGAFLGFLIAYFYNLFEGKAPK